MRSKRGFALSRWLSEPVISDGLFFLASLPFWNCILWPKFFPETPWLAIPKSARNRRMTEYLHSSRKILFEVKRSTKGLRHWEVSDADTRRLKSAGIEYRVIMFDWASGTNNEIIEPFANWVRHSRPAQFPSPRTDASRENVTAAFPNTAGSDAFATHAYAQKRRGTCIQTWAGNAKVPKQSIEHTAKG
jgi:hypothetical protein